MAETIIKKNPEEVAYLEEVTKQQSTDYSGSRKKTSAEEVRLVRKLDLIILPTLWLMYFFNFLDRTAITVAVLDNIDKDLHLSSTQYSACISILFAGYILGQIPSSM